MLIGCSIRVRVLNVSASRRRRASSRSFWRAWKRPTISPAVGGGGPSWPLADRLRGGIAVPRDAPDDAGGPPRRVVHAQHRAPLVDEARPLRTGGRRRAVPPRVEGVPGVGAGARFGGRHGKGVGEQAVHQAASTRKSRSRGRPSGAIAPSQASISPVTQSSCWPAGAL